jgi:hypothetical protein
MSSGTGKGDRGYAQPIPRRDPRQPVAESGRAEGVSSGTGKGVCTCPRLSGQSFTGCPVHTKHADVAPPAVTEPLVRAPVWVIARQRRVDESQGMRRFRRRRTKSQLALALSVLASLGFDPADFLR